MVHVSFSNSSPTPSCVHLTASLHAMHSHCLSHSISNLAIPEIACGLVGLFGSKVSQLLHCFFQDVSNTISVYKNSVPPATVPSLLPPPLPLPPPPLLTTNILSLQLLCVYSSSSFVGCTHFYSSLSLAAVFYPLCQHLTLFVIVVCTGCLIQLRYFCWFHFSTNYSSVFHNFCSPSSAFL